LRGTKWFGLATLALALSGGVALAQAKPAPPAPTPAPAATAPAAGGESPGQRLLEQDESAQSGRTYTYDPAGRRDPFRSLLIRAENRAGQQRPPGIAGIAIDDLILQGIWKTKAGYVAQIRGTDNKSYLIRAGDLLYDGEVTRIGPNEVSFRQNLNDPQSVKPFRDVTKQLNATVKS
jgi:Tfp pilus assembly protein PilP